MNRKLSSDESFDFRPDSTKLESLAEFAAGIGHELNNPLAIINGRVQLLQRRYDDVQTRRDLAEIQAAVFRASEMIADIRLFACPPEPTFETTDLSSVLNQLKTVFVPLIERRSIEIKLAGTETPALIEADPGQMAILFQAVVRNSIEAIGEKGTVSIALHSAAETDDCRIVVVSDNGPGLTEYEARHAFDPYYSARQANRGLGFGLCKAWRIVQMHAGDIQVQSCPPAGSTFQISLPIVQTERQEKYVEQSGEQS